MVQADKNAGLARESALLEGKCQLKAALSSALESKAEVEAALQTARLDQQRLQQEASVPDSMPEHAFINVNVQQYSSASLLSRYCCAHRLAAECQQALMPLHIYSTGTSADYSCQTFSTMEIKVTFVLTVESCSRSG